MPYIKRKQTKTGGDYYDIRVSRGRGKSYLSMRWPVPDGWSQRALDREVRKVAAEFERKCHAGEVISKAEQADADAQDALERAKLKTLRQYAENVYLPLKQVSCAKRTVQSYEWTFNKIIFSSPIVDMKMQEITPAQLTALIAKYQAAGNAHASVVRLYSILHNFFTNAYLDETIYRNPMDRVERPKPRKDEIKNDEVETYTPEETQHILECMKAEPLRWRVFVALLIETGIRRGECCALRWENIDLKENTIQICGSLSYTAQSGVFLDTPKNAKVRTVYITDSMSALLKRFKREQKILSPWVFCNEKTGKVMNPQTPTRHLKEIAQRYGFEHFHPHKLRHTFASIAITNGADVVSVSEILGHADTSITLRIYSHATEESRKRASAIMHNAIKADEA